MIRGDQTTSGSPYQLPAYHLTAGINGKTAGSKQSAAVFYRTACHAVNSAMILTATAPPVTPCGS